MSETISNCFSGNVYVYGYCLYKQAGILITINFLDVDVVYLFYDSVNEQ